MKETTLTILENTPLTHDTYRLRLAGDTSAITAPGQFVNLKLAGFFLRRPISVCDWAEGELTLIYKVLGRGTAAMTAFAPGAALSVLTGLGNGYDTSCSGERPLLVGGGVGIPPLYGLARRLRAADVFLADELRALGVNVHIATDDGSAGLRGLVTDAMDAAGDGYTHLYTCGPEPMLRAVYDRCRTDGQFSFEERMAASARAWAARARRNTAQSASVRTAPSCGRERLYGKHIRHALRPAAGKPGDPRERHVRLWV